MTKTEELLVSLRKHYESGEQDMQQRKERKNGWDAIIDAYMGKLPSNWPYNAKVTDPRIRTTILEKTSRLLNAKLQGRLVPREGGDVVKARINNALLDFQWDFAQNGGSMIEKIAYADQTCRLFGAAFALVYWDTTKNSNDIKIIDQRDIFFDGAATHVKNARWADVREFTTFDVLEDRGYDMSKAWRLVKKGDITNNRQDTKYTSKVKENRQLENRVGDTETSDPKNPIVEVVTEWRRDRCIIWLPKYDILLKDGPNPYYHGDVPIAQLRYYPLGDDIYGESEVEAVISMQRAINALLSGFVDEMNIRMRPPLKVSSQGVRLDTIEYGPGARWIMQAPGLVQQMEFSGQTVQSFNATYPALVAAFNTAMGDQSLGISNIKGYQTDKTATEVQQLAKQQNTRDQYNQLYLSEFLKDIMTMWLSNNKQYLFDDESKHYHILKIIGRDKIAQFQQVLLDGKDIPDFATNQIAQTMTENPGMVSEDMLMQITQDVAVPQNPVILNPKEKNPENYELKPKLDQKGPNEADLYITKDDFEGVYDYVPDVASMAMGTLESTKQGINEAMMLITSPQVQQLLLSQGASVNVKELVVSLLESKGYKDAEGLFIENQPNAQPALPPGQGAPGAVQPNIGAMPAQGMEQVPVAPPSQPIQPGVPSAF